MGTPLTGTTPQDTYDSLIKVTDNGPLTTSLKVLTDGLGNDSTLSLSTTAASIAGNLTVTGEALFDTNTLFVDASNNRVGIGLVSPTEKLHIKGTAANTVVLIQDTTGYALLNNNNTSGNIFFGIDNSIGSGFSGGAYSRHIFSEGAYPLIITTNSAERMRIDSSGNVGIGTSTVPRLLTLKNNAGATNGISFQSLATTSEIAAIECNQTLDTIDFEMLSAFAGNGFRFLTGTPTLVERARFTANGLTFNGDTAAANALDDYEEGIWTFGVAFGGGTTGITYADQQGTYTKIGRKVTVNGYLAFSNKGSSTGNATITGLPFTIGAGAAYYSAASLWLYNVSFADVYQGYGQIGNTIINLGEITNAGVFSALSDADFANNSELIVSITYFV